MKKRGGSVKPGVRMLDEYIRTGVELGLGREQLENFVRAGVVLMRRQLEASAAARACDVPGGPMEIGYGGARGGGKSFWMLTQMGVDDCQRVAGLKCLLLRKVGKANLEHFEDLRQVVFRLLPHEFAVKRGVLMFGNRSKIVAGHFQSEKDIDAYLGLEYDVIGVEEATTLSWRKYEQIRTCCRSSKSLPSGARWRPRIYSTTNPGGVGHAWYRERFIRPFERVAEKETRFIPASVRDNPFANEDYVGVLESLKGWQRRAWLDGSWDIAAGQYFTVWRRDKHVIKDFDDNLGREWFAALDYGFTHYTVVLLGCRYEGKIYIVDEHAGRLWLPERHVGAVKAMLARHKQGARSLELRDLKWFVAGADVFARQSDGTSVADQYKKLGVRLRPANMDRVNGWAAVLSAMGDPESGIEPRLYVHERCRRVIETIPCLQHDPNRPEDVLKVDADEEGVGGDDAADALRYLVATKPKVPGVAVV